MFSFCSNFIRFGSFRYFFQCSHKETFQHTSLLAGEVKKCQKLLLVKSISQNVIFFLQKIIIKWSHASQNDVLIILYSYTSDC